MVPEPGHELNIDRGRWGLHDGPLEVGEFYYRDRRPVKARSHTACVADALAGKPKPTLTGV